MRVGFFSLPLFFLWTLSGCAIGPSPPSPWVTSGDGKIYLHLADEKNSRVITIPEIVPGEVSSPQSFRPLSVTSLSCNKNSCKGSAGRGEIVLTRISPREIHLDLTGYSYWGIAYTLTPEEKIGGGGMTFASLNLRGIRIPLQLELDPRSDSGLNEVHLPLSLWISTRGYGVYRESDGPGYIDVGRTSENRLVLYQMGKETIRFIGGSPREISTLFLNWQGGWVGIPEWTHGILFWRNENSHTGEIYEDLNKLKTLGYPVSAIWIDNPWETARNTFVIDKNRFPGIEDLLDELKKEGVEIFLWISNHINLPSAETLDRSSLIPVLKEVQREKLYVTNEDGSPLIAPWGSGLGYILNFTNESLLPWLEKKVLPLFSMGFKGWKLDYGEDIVPWVLFPGVSQKARLKEGDPLYAHAIYKRAYHRSFSELTRKYHPDGFLLSRSGGFGEPSLTNCLWPGDIDNNLAFPTLLYDPGEPGEFSTYHPSPYIHSPGGLPTAILATLHLSLSGVPCLATDTGGFRGGTPSPLPFLRWAQFSAYQPVMQIGGAGDHRPWSPVFETPLFPAEEIIRFYAREHLLWYPYLLSYIEKAQEGKDLIVYPALYDHPSAPWIPENHFLYYLGREILVRPIVEEKQPTKVELPSGKWVEFFTGTKEEGRIEKIYPYDRIGLWLKGGTALPRLKEIPEKVNRENLLKGVDLELYFTPLFGGEKWSLKSSYFSVEVNPATDTVTVTVSPPSFLKISLGVSGCVEGGTVEGEDGGQISLPPSGWVSFPRKVKKAVIRCFR